MKEFLEEKKEQLFDGELTITKLDFWLIVLLVFTVGVLYGLVKAPWTHGVKMTIGSNNGNNNNVGAEDECECIGCCECEEEEDEDVISFK
ncbi:MAG: hypothetical protein IJZ76_02020 [Lachnospiraceae bacterium]|nr:hypothetical protein [Lachnospiraceae bacterium]